MIAPTAIINGLGQSIKLDIIKVILNLILNKIPFS